MIDMILLAVMCGVFYGGFKCGNRFASLKEMANSVLKKFQDATK